VTWPKWGLGTLQRGIWWHLWIGCFISNILTTLVTTNSSVVGDLVGDPTDKHRTCSKFQSSPRALTSTNPLILIHYYKFIATFPKYYANYESNPYWGVSMDEEYQSSIKNQTSELVPLPSSRNLFNENGFIKKRW